ncbi:antA/AntB antirepressor family protein [Rodentibacter haemolyticus]|uniref:AntA/AntB antirepressor family protein n=1 Tax=Rodentibacter haemolyticus TaxID=2778911 RepID=A0ABX6UZ56_9PAST|nr:antA/AntB antirepressor family protein [Rodentibacter haemolyticus]QPB42663.1 antA/AntB antirepressor family protein [Rodentibacter haemolyticus]
MNLNELLSIQTFDFINGQTANGINARPLHQALRVGRDFSNWIKARIKQGGFIENQDFITVQNIAIGTPKRANQKGGNMTGIEYILTLDMAKHLCLMERNEIGKAIRQHFINAEKRLAEVAPKVYKNTLQASKARLASIDHQHAMNEAIKQYIERQGKTAKPHHFINDNEMLESLVLGINVRHWKAANGITDNAKNHFNASQLELLTQLMMTNTSLLNLDMPYQQRKTHLSGLAQRYLSQSLAA